MRRLFTIIVSIFLLSPGIVVAEPTGDNKEGQKTEQNTQKKGEKKEEKKEEKKDDDKNAGKPRKPIDLVYEFAWPWIMR